MSVKSGKTQFNVILMSKRNLYENDKNRFNYQNNNNWIENSFTNNNNNNNNKRTKTDNQWTYVRSVESVSNPSHGLTSNTNSVSLQNQAMNVDDDEDNELNDGLDDLISQAVEQSQYCYSSNTESQEMGRTTDQNMASQPTTAVKFGSDVSMNTNTTPSHQSSNDSSEASEGRLKILESRNQKLNEEMLRFKTQNIQLKHKLREIEIERQRKMNQMSDNFESSIKFETNERLMQAQLLERLNSQLKRFAPNSPIVKMATEYLRGRKRPFSQDFSQLKIQEFYDDKLSSANTATMASIFSQNTPLSCGDVLVQESQSSVCSKRAKFGATFPTNFPSQISSTQMEAPISISATTSMSWTPHQMDISSNEQTLVREADSSQTSQTQSSRINWNHIRTVLEQKFTNDSTQLNQFFFEEPINGRSLFDDQWIRQNQETTDLSTTLNELSNELGINFQRMVTF